MGWQTSAREKKCPCAEAWMPLCRGPAPSRYSLPRDPGIPLPRPGCLCCGAGPFCWPLPFKLTKGPRERRRKKYRRIIGIQLTTDGLDGNGTEACSAAYRMSAIPGNVLRETWRRSERAGTAARPVSCTVLFFRILYCTCSYICLVYISVRTYALFSYIIL